MTLPVTEVRVFFAAELDATQLLSSQQGRDSGLTLRPIEFCATDSFSKAAPSVVRATPP
jgi:hypothetical protein